MNDVVLNITGIKCDNPACSFRNDDVRVNEYKSWLNRSCPQCSSNLLTQADYDSVQMMIMAVEEQNKAVPVNNISEPIIFVDIEMNGSGDLITRNISLEDI